MINPRPALGAGLNEVLSVFASVLAAASFMFVLSSMTPLPASADEVHEIEGTLARGGRLYDKWYAVIGTEAPEQTHAAYPAEGTQEGSGTWRCKECHGWDYMGKDGAYASGSHFSGIVGINGKAGADISDIVAILKDENHGYGGLMDDHDLQDVATFVSLGQVNMDQFIDRASKMAASGDKAKGAAYFNTICVGCHRMDGTYPKDMEKTLGAQMGNPWEVMHKILNGQPDQKMPALRALDRQVILDIMAHVATLPKEK